MVVCNLKRCISICAFSVADFRHRNSVGRHHDSRNVFELLAVYWGQAVFAASDFHRRGNFHFRGGVFRMLRRHKGKQLHVDHGELLQSNTIFLVRTSQ